MEIENCGQMKTKRDFSDSYESERKKLKGIQEAETQVIQECSQGMLQMDIQIEEDAINDDFEKESIRKVSIFSDDSSNSSHYVTCSSSSSCGSSHSGEYNLDIDDEVEKAKNEIRRLSQFYEVKERETVTLLKLIKLKELDMLDLKKQKAVKVSLELEEKLGLGEFDKSSNTSSSSSSTNSKEANQEDRLKTPGGSIVKDEVAKVEKELKDIKLEIFNDHIMHNIIAKQLGSEGVDSEAARILYESLTAKVRDDPEPAAAFKMNIDMLQDFKNNTFDFSGQGLGLIPYRGDNIATAKLKELMDLANSETVSKKSKASHGSSIRQATQNRPKQLLNVQNQILEAEAALTKGLNMPLDKPIESVQTFNLETQSDIVSKNMSPPPTAPTPNKAKKSQKTLSSVSLLNVRSVDSTPTSKATTTAVPSNRFLSKRNTSKGNRSANTLSQEAPVASTVTVLSRSRQVPQKQQAKKVSIMCQWCELKPAGFVCADCAAARYCSEDCQAAAWSIHSQECKSAIKN